MDECMWMWNPRPFDHVAAAAGSSIPNGAFKKPSNSELKPIPFVPLSYGKSSSHLFTPGTPAGSPSIDHRFGGHFRGRRRRHGRAWAAGALQGHAMCDGSWSSGDVGEGVEGSGSRSPETPRGEDLPIHGVFGVGIRCWSVSWKMTGVLLKSYTK